MLLSHTDRQTDTCRPLLCAFRYGRSQPYNPLDIPDKADMTSLNADHLLTAASPKIRYHAKIENDNYYLVGGIAAVA